jgi:hypothetical protein
LGLLATELQTVEFCKKALFNDSLEAEDVAFGGGIGNQILFSLMLFGEILMLSWVIPAWRNSPKSAVHALQQTSP